MISPADLISSIARLTARIPGGAARPDDVEAPPGAPAPGAAETHASVPPAQTLIKPPALAGDSLAGLATPLPLDQTKAALGLMSTDEVRVTIGDSSGSSTQTAVGATTSSASGDAIVHASTTKVQPAFLARLGKFKDVDQTLKPEAVRQLAGALSERIRATPKALLALAEAARADVQPLLSERAGVMASSILNAAMSPGWPQPLALQSGPVAETQAVYGAFEEMDEAQLLDLVAALGGDEVLQARLISASAEAERRRKLLRAACILATLVGLFVTALRMEIEELLGDFALIASGAAPESWSGRIRLRLK